MLSLAMATVVALTGGPDAIDPRRVVEHVLGANGEGRVAVVFPDGPHTRATIYLRKADRWCRIGSGEYLRGSTLVDRGGGNRGIRLIDRRERAVDMRWIGGRLVLTRQGRRIAALDAPARGCK